ncbi:MAG: hypothetical protein IPN09_01115 [Bacteroidetes bacterium]|nr:hypothetical protein [Bacteroidota bacterium]
MKKLLYFSTLLFACFFLLVACSKKEDIPEGSIDEYYFVKTDGAVLPVRITGKENSFGYLIMTHGGPGGTAQLFRNSIGVHDLEKTLHLFIGIKEDRDLRRAIPVWKIIILNNLIRIWMLL